MRDERHRRLEFNTTAIIILNNLEHMGYRVVTSGSFVASQANNNNKVMSKKQQVEYVSDYLQASKHRFIQREFVWTIHRKSNDIQ